MTETMQQAHSDPISMEITERLESLPDAARIKDLAQLTATIDELTRLLENVSGERLNRDLSDRIEELRRRYTDKRERLRIIGQARLKVNDHLENAQRLHDNKSPVAVVVEQYESAASHIRGLRESRDWDEADVVELRVLQSKAESAREEYLNDHERPTTRQEGGQLAALILRFAEQTRKNPEYQVSYFMEASFNAPIEKMSVEMALRHARAILRDYWESKITDYLDLARQKLEEHKPRDAGGELQRIVQLPGRDNPEIGVDLPRDTLEAIEMMRTRVNGDIAALDAAESELRRAGAILDSSEVDALAADHHYQNAVGHYAFVGDKDAVRTRILDAARREIDHLLDTAEEQLRREAWGQAEAALKRLEKLLALHPPATLLDARARCDTLAAVQKAVAGVVSTERKLSPTDERDQLSRLSVTFADDYWPGWKGLGRRLARLQTLRNLESLGEKVDAACKPMGSQAELQDLADALEDLQKNPPVDAPKDKLAGIPAMRRKVNGWLGYARARDELAKAPKGGISPTVSPDELILHEVADLKVAKAGLEASKQDRIAEEAARQHKPNLFTRLLELETHDARAYRILSDAQEFLEQGGRPDAEELHRKMVELRKQLGHPTSYRQELLVTYHDIRKRLVAIYSNELRKLLDTDRDNYFRNLSDSDLERRLGQLKSVATDDEESDDNLTRQVELARSMARAFRIEQQVQNGIFSWEDAKQAWETARERAEIGSEHHSYTLHRERHAHKQAVFRQSANAGEAAGDLLRNLTEDKILQNDWEVWFRHGEYLFSHVRTAVAPNLPYETNVEHLGEARQAVDVARQSLRRAEALVRDKELTQAAEIENQKKLPGLQVAIDQWSILLRAFDQYHEILDEANPQHADYLSLIQTHNDTDNQLERPQGNAPDAKRWHNGLWAQVLNKAEDRLDERLNVLPPNDILGRLNTLLGMAILFPDNTKLQQRMTNQSTQILHDLDTLVDETVGDYGGSAFTRRYLTRTKRSPEPKDHLSEQLEEARDTAVALENYHQTLSRIQLGHFTVSDDLLAKLSDRLSRWVDELEAYRDALDNAMRMSVDGLRAPVQFDKARHILRVAQSVHTDLSQVPPEFKNANHPTYRWATDTIDVDLKRRERQESLRDKINALIEKERIGVGYALRARADDTLRADEWAEVEGIETTLRQLRDYLRDMLLSEPDDPTFLQQGLSYQMPEDQEQYYRGAKSIEAVIVGKLEQHRLISAWLSEWADTNNKFIKVIDWPKEKGKIAARRNRGPGNLGLNEALRQCREAMNGDGSADYKDKPWPLVPARAELSHLGMRRSLAANDGAEASLLYGLTEPLNRRRAQLEAILTNYINEAEKMEANIIWRSNNFQVRFDDFIAKKDVLLSTHVWFWQVWEQMPVFLEFQRAAEAFCAICPDYQAFLEAKEDAQRHTGRTFYCAEED